MSLAYRPDIDGLRSLAILPVVIFHANAAWMPGGFVGVDIFFVISGYLITRLIAAEVGDTGRFRFGTFYLRRVRRLLPALLCTALLAWLGAMLLLPPDEMRDFGASMVAAVLSFSNIHFWLQTDYFDAAAATKPLLNTWSLSVEEQFYLIWPVLLVLALPRMPRFGLLLGMGVVLVLCIAATEHVLTRDPAAGFYLLPFRIPELGIGAMLALTRWRPSSTATSRVLGCTGVLAIVASLALFDEATPFPGVSALLPCLGTAAIIASGPTGPVASVLRLAPLVWTGRISYSVYLVHWPLMVFHDRLSEYHGPLLPDWSLVAASLALGWLQFQLIEQKFRYTGPKSWRPRTFALGAIAMVFLTISPGAIAYWDKGHQWRIPATRSEHTNKEWFKIEQRTYCRQRNPDLDPKLVTCQLSRGAPRDLFLWGDSHALHYVSGFAEHYPNHNIYVLYYGGCVVQSGTAGFVRDYRDANTDRCIVHNRNAMALFEAHRPSDVVVVGAKRATPEKIAPPTREILQKLRQAGHTVALVGDTIRPGLSLNACGSVPSLLVPDDVLAKACEPVEKIAVRELTYNAELAKLIPETILTDAVQCPDGVCRFRDDEGTLLFRDNHHLNVPGAIYFVEALKPRLPF
ncbi:MAG: acyltransferase family protein [Pseudomonadota bacterium]